MSFFSSLFRCLCLCVVIEKGSWTPNTKENTNKHQKKVLKKRFHKLDAKRRDKSRKPEWLKEWTISRGWVHNKSHLLELGTSNPVAMNGKTYEELSDDSSVSLENVEDLISIRSNNYDFREESRNANDDETSDDASSVEVQINRSSLQNVSKIYHQMTENYREHFPESSRSATDFKDASLPEVYKERLLFNEERSKCGGLGGFWNYVKPKSKKKVSLNDCKFTVNRLYDDSTNKHSQTSVVEKYTKRNSLGRNIALYNTLNAKTNLHEEPIYECSEETSNYNSLNNVYFNPAYVPFENPKKISSNDNQMCVLNRLNGYHEDRINFRHNYQNSAMKMRNEKYVIRHIRVRIMLSLRVGKIQRVKKKPKMKKNKFFRGKNKHMNDKVPSENLEFRVTRMHEEQRRIGNGRTSIKIQNMR
ncbi:unnamed protein product [Phaedon cochleariae]|uniref:Uncharacterized protein n=1 Tax=Phaedon cochleariae TaxID=80249 RepID=A0A9N9X020_PHACE|nr:unnamed protein product [Phaedon cochleariae]